MPIRGSNDWNHPYLNENIDILTTPFLLNNVFSINATFLFAINKLTSICLNANEAYWISCCCCCKSTSLPGIRLDSFWRWELQWICGLAVPCHFTPGKSETERPDSSIIKSGWRLSCSLPNSEQNHASFVHSIFSMSDFVVRSALRVLSWITVFFFSLLFNLSSFAHDSTGANYSHVDTTALFFNPKDTGVTKGTCHVKSTLFSLRDCNRRPIAMGTAEAFERRLPVIGSFICKCCQSC